MKQTEEKAREIVIKMQFQKEPLMFDQAKKCALIAVDEILNALKRPPNFNRQVVNINTLDYWKEVKQEIEKL